VMLASLSARWRTLPRPYGRTPKCYVSHYRRKASNLLIPGEKYGRQTRQFICQMDNSGQSWYGQIRDTTAPDHAGRGRGSSRNSYLWDNR
jgi:hypothetical protein